MSDPRESPAALHELHIQAEAEFQSYGQIPIVSTFGEPQAEYAAIRKSCGMMDLPQRGVIELTGKDRLSFLNNLLTNQTWDKQTKSGLSAGQGVYAFLLNAKTGRIVTDLNVLERGERTLLELDARMVEAVRTELERYLFSEQVQVRALDDVIEIALHGPKSIEVLEACDPRLRLRGLPLLGSADARLFETDVTIWRDDPTGSFGFYLLIPRESARTIWMNLLTQFGDPREIGTRMLRPIGWAAYNATRIEAGRPMFGIDFDDTILPAETGLLDRAVSFTKGCYPGQEIVARMHARQQLSRRIAGVRMNDDALPVAGAKVYDDQSNEIGGVTSSTVSPVLSNVAICLALLKKPHFNVGTVVMIPAEGEMRKGTVVELPFLKSG